MCIGQWISGKVLSLKFSNYIRENWKKICKTGINISFVMRLSILGLAEAGISVFFAIRYIRYFNTNQN